jgi:crotonobetainyl-CoA:carnitine CoA-transferase CaiB-like acyl-CoA transferase
LSGLLEGVRVVEVAVWGFAPTASRVLGEWGADVVKIEHPVHGDPVRGLHVSGNSPDTGGVAIMPEIFNAGRKRSLGLDLRNEQGLSILHRLVATSDVFLTSFRRQARAAMRFDEEDVREHNPTIVYARASALGPEGPEADRPGYDNAALWARSGLNHASTPAGASEPAGMPSPAFGDVLSGLTLAGGVAAALAHRARTGNGVSIDVSLLHVGMWSIGPEITATNLLGIEEFWRGDRAHMTNPLSGAYRTKDGRFIQLTMLEADRHWPEVCRLIGRPELVDDERFQDQAARTRNVAACAAALDAAFAEQPLDHWREVLAAAEGTWAVVQKPTELRSDPQVVANGYMRDVANNDGTTYSIVPNPVQVSGEPPELRCAPEHGADTEAVLLDLGYGWDDIIAFKEAGAVM